MTEFIRNNKWRMFKIVFLLGIFLGVFAFIQGRNIYNQKVQQLEEANRAFGR